MTNIEAKNPFQFFTELNGEALEAGNIYIGVAGLDAEANQIIVYWDEEGTIPATQPIRTLAGYPSNSGTISKFYTGSDYSIKVLDSNSSLVESSVSGNLDTSFFVDKGVVGESLIATTVADVNIFEGQWYRFADRNNSLWRVISGTTGSDTYSLVQCTGVPSLQLKLEDNLPINVKATGAIGDDVANDYQPINNAIEYGNGAVYLPSGDYRLTSDKLGEYQFPVNITGDTANTNIIVNNLTKTGIRIGAVGGSDTFVSARIITRIADLNFKTTSKPATGVDIQSVNPFVMENVRFFEMGAQAMQLAALFYGSCSNCYFVNSGIHFINVNNYGFFSGDIRPSAGAGGDRGLSDFPQASVNFPVVLENSDCIKFYDYTFEGWIVPVLNLELAKATSFNQCWFEANEGAYVIALRQAQSIDFNDCFLDLDPQASGSFFRVDNSAPETGTEDNWSPRINIRGGLLRTKASPSTSVPLLTSVNLEAASIGVSDLTFTRGFLFTPRYAEIDVKSISLETQDGKLFHTKPNALMLNSYNSWMPDSLSSDWDFAAGANFTFEAPLSVATTTTAGEFLTGTRGVKVSNVTNGTTAFIDRDTGTNGDMGQVTALGQTYIFFIRILTTTDMSLEFRLFGDNGVKYNDSPPIETKEGRWTDYVFKSDEVNTFAHQDDSSPNFNLNITNNSGATGEVLIDRIDYQIVTGDFHI